MGSRCRFIQPDTTTVPLSDGDVLTVKASLNTAEQHALFDEMREHGGPATSRSLVALVSSYLVNWTLTDAKGALVKIEGLDRAGVERVLGNLDPVDFTEIAEAVSAHDERVREARKARKNGQAGASAPANTSTSPAAAAGA